MQWTLSARWATVSRARLLSMAEDGDTRARHVLKITEDNERLIGAVLPGNNPVNILATSPATMLFASLFGEGGVAAARS